MAMLVVLGIAVYLVARFQGRVYVPLPPTSTAVVLLVPKPTVAGEPTTVAQPTPETEPVPDHLKDLPPGRVNILVLGTDKRPNDPDHYARSDTLLLASVDTVSHTVGIMSIPRDLIVNIPGHGRNKVNSAYLFGEYYQEPGGGQALAVRSISQFFNVPIAYYVAVNFDGFRKVVDTVGGVDVDVPYEMDDLNYPSDDLGDPFGEIHVHFDAGWQHMDGLTALRYARTRHADNDFARSRRQLQIILAARQKAMSLDLLPSIPKLMDDLGGMLETNILFDQQLAFVQLGYTLDASRIVTSSIDSTMITPATLPDGSEGLKLNTKLAQPMLDSFFGLDKGVSSREPGAAAPLEAATPPVAKANRARPSATPESTQPSSKGQSGTPARTKGPAKSP